VAEKRSGRRNTELTGPLLAGLAATYVGAINDGAYGSHAGCAARKRELECVSRSTLHPGRVRHNSSVAYASTRWGAVQR
jgi:hypothetical protein